MLKAARLNIDEMEEQCMRLIDEAGARLDMAHTGVHYVLSSTYHSEFFFNMPRAFERYSTRNYLAQFFLRKMKLEMKESDIDLGAINVLIGPATGALPLLYTLQSFPELDHTRVMFAERVSRGGFSLGRGFEFQENDQVFIADDVGTTFSSIRGVKKLLEQFSCSVVGAGVMVDRSPMEKEVEHPKNKALGMRFVCGVRAPHAYYENECPHCKNGIPLMRI